MMSRSNDGWTLNDLAGELSARGIDIDDVSDDAIQRAISCEKPEQAAERIAEE